ncbi:lipoprotein [Azoarcus olearius]|uniref:peptidoglycan DD-metalloendopeptidase family protein n=1 Tax=Azoarcus sp. (strain BH72) TaxID=418699 RepID=UPI0008062098|nr:peptidoglycan DD-metalloendopeptidase family protein [Azoarcus olearius]ANQ84254.1 lipoprotein [Azoarcus olearius]
MNDSVNIKKRIAPYFLALGVLFLAGCASRAPVAVRDGNGVAPPPAAAPVADRAGVHVVRAGETLLGIARQYGQNVKDLVVWNGLTNPNQIHVGQEIRVLPPDANAIPGGAVATPIPITSEPPVAVPVVPQPATAGALKLEPKGGKQPYSDELWARVRRSGEPAAPVASEPRATQAPEQEPGDAEWLWPAKGKVLSGFNEATNKGIDISGNPGDSVVASAAGRVVYAGSGLRGYGKLVIIKHNQEYNSVYAHNQKLLVKEDDQVSQGQKIAELGSTDADRPKLHFEIRKQGRPVDPMKFLSAR